MLAVSQGPWQPGTVIVQQEYWRSKLVGVRPLDVVEDSETLLALYASAGGAFRLGRWEGAPNRRQLSLEERVRVYLSDEQPALDERISRFHVLTLLPPGARHSFKLFWDPDWSFLNWYVNLERPYQRIDGGIVVRDLFLDIVVEPGFEWAWKDEDELEAVYAAGGLHEEEYRRVREEGLRMVKRIETGDWPFNMDWPNWRPVPSWSAPAIPAGWHPHRPVDGP